MFNEARSRRRFPAIQCAPCSSIPERPHRDCVEIPAPPRLPCGTRGDELRRRDVHRVTFEIEHLPPCRIELRVDHLPPPLGRVPVLRHPVVLEPTGPEVRPEPTAGPGWHACGPEKRDGDPAERVAARPDPAARGPGLVERTGVQFSGYGKKASGVPLVDGLCLLRLELHAVERLRNDVVDQQPLYDFDDPVDVVGSEHVALQRGEASRRGVELERVLRLGGCHGELSPYSAASSSGHPNRSRASCSEIPRTSPMADHECPLRRATPTWWRRPISATFSSRAAFLTRVRSLSHSSYLRSTGCIMGRNSDRFNMRPSPQPLLASSSFGSGRTRCRSVLRRLPEHLDPSDQSPVVQLECVGLLEMQRLRRGSRGARSPARKRHDGRPNTSQGGRRCGSRRAPPLRAWPGSGHAPRPGRRTGRCARPPAPTRRHSDVQSRVLRCSKKRSTMPLIGAPPRRPGPGSSRPPIPRRPPAPAPAGPYRR